MNQQNAAALFQNGLALQAAGRLREAIGVWHALLASYPDQPQALAQLGLAEHWLGESDKGEQRIVRALQVAPDEPGLYFNHASLLYERGRLDEAVRQLAVLRGLPNVTPALLALAVDLYLWMEMAEEAGACLDSLPDAELDQPANLKRSASIALRQRDFDTGVGAAKRALAANRGDPEAFELLGANALSSGRHEQDVADCQAQVARLPVEAQVRINLSWARQCVARLDYARAATLLRPHAGAATDNAELAFVFARACLMSDALAEGRPVIDQYVTRWPDDAQGWSLKARYHLALGEKEASEDAARRALEKDPGLSSALRTLAENSPQAIDDAMIARFSQEKLSPRLGPEEHRSIGFALGRAWEARGDHERAFEEYAYANHWLAELCRQEGAVYHPGKVRERFEDVKRAHRFLVDHAEPAQWRRDDLPTPVFIVGLPRSGTTLVEQILSSHADVYGGGEMPILPRIENALQDVIGGTATGEDWQDRCAALVDLWYAPARESGGTYRAITDKMPTNFACLGLIDLLFPTAKIIHVRRDIRDVGFSLYTGLFSKAHPYATDLDHIADFYHYYREAMAHWDAVLDRPILHIDYERLVQDFEGSVRAMADHVGLGWTDDFLRFHENERTVLTLSAAQVRQPLYGSSIGRWRPFADHLGPLLALARADGAEPAAD